MTRLPILLYVIFILSCVRESDKRNDCYPVRTSPVFQVDCPQPTADKPQSKLWFMNNSWWALLPRKSGPSLWQRTDEGWKEYKKITDELEGIPGRADVWSDDSQVTAVSVGDSLLSVFRLINTCISGKNNWKAQILAELLPPSHNMPLETATVARDGNKNWWVAATADKNVCVWSSSKDGQRWTDPFILAEGISEDDICAVTPLKGSIAVIWSDQVRDAVLMRQHKDFNHADVWEEEEIVESGNNTADDHLNTSLSPDGTLWVATKNSVDKAGKPQFVLRIRSADGKWINKPYCVLENRMKRPSRPIVIATKDNSCIFVGHGDNDRSVPYPYNSNITFALVDTSLSTVVKDPQIVISPDSRYKHVVHNVTGPRKPFPADAPWIILA